MSRFPRGQTRGEPISFRTSEGAKIARLDQWSNFLGNRLTTRRFAGEFVSSRLRSARLRWGLRSPLRSRTLGSSIRRDKSWNGDQERRRKGERERSGGISRMKKSVRSRRHPAGKRSTFLGQVVVVMVILRSFGVPLYNLVRTFYGTLSSCLIRFSYTFDCNGTIAVECRALLLTRAFIIEFKYSFIFY